MKITWNFLGGRGGCQTKNLPWGEYGFFLELHNSQKCKDVYFLSGFFLFFYLSQNHTCCCSKGLPASFISPICQVERNWTLNISDAKASWGTLCILTIYFFMHIWKNERDHSPRKGHWITCGVYYCWCLSGFKQTSIIQWLSPWSVILTIGR